MNEFISSEYMEILHRCCASHLADVKQHVHGCIGDINKCRAGIVT